MHPLLDAYHNRPQIEKSFLQTDHLAVALFAPENPVSRQKPGFTRQKQPFRAKNLALRAKNSPFAPKTWLYAPKKASVTYNLT